MTHWMFYCPRCKRRSTFRERVARDDFFFILIENTDGDIPRHASFCKQCYKWGLGQLRSRDLAARRNASIYIPENPHEQAIAKEHQNSKKNKEKNTEDENEEKIVITNIFPEEDDSIYEDGSDRVRIQKPVQQSQNSGVNQNHVHQNQNHVHQNHHVNHQSENSQAQVYTSGRASHFISRRANMVVRADVHAQEHGHAQEQGHGHEHAHTHGHGQEHAPEHAQAHVYGHEHAHVHYHYNYIPHDQPSTSAQAYAQYQYELQPQFQRASVITSTHQQASSGNIVTMNNDRIVEPGLPPHLRVRELGQLTHENTSNRNYSDEPSTSTASTVPKARSNENSPTNGPKRRNDNTNVPNQGSPKRRPASLGPLTSLSPKKSATTKTVSLPKIEFSPFKFCRPVESPVLTKDPMINPSEDPLLESEDALAPDDEATLQIHVEHPMQIMLHQPTEPYAPDPSFEEAYVPSELIEEAYIPEPFGEPFVPDPFPPDPFQMDEDQFVVIPMPVSSMIEQWNEEEQLESEGNKTDKDHIMKDEKK